MIGYVTIGTNDLDGARAFYDELLGILGARRLMQLENQHGFTLYGKEITRANLVVTRPYNDEPAQPGNGNMVALAVSKREQVDALHAKALALGGSDEGAPGFRGDPKNGYYFAYFRDLDGNKLAVFNIAPQV